jgi:hypothetical protein
MGHTVPIRGKKEHTIPDLLYGLAIDVGRFGEIRLRTFPYVHYLLRSFLANNASLTARWTAVACS